MKPIQIILSLLGSLIGSLALLSTGVAEAQISPTAPLQFVPPAAPERGRPPGRHQGGASRGGCSVDGQPPLTAIIPFLESETTDGVESANLEATAKDAVPAIRSLTSRSDVYSLTTQAYPSFWFYVPYSLETTPLEFVLQDENDNTLYQERVFSGTLENQVESIDSDRGIIQVTLPDAAPALEAGMTYHWFFLAYCDQDDPSFVEGWVTRSPLPTAADALLTATPREQAFFYAQNSIWQEALTVLGEHYKGNATDAAVSRDWESLLESVNLGHLAEQPLVDCCSLE